VLGAPLTPVMPMINIIEPHDVILAQIAANLHLDQLQRNFPRVGEAMDAPMGT
jgi:hypothetical protein